MKRLLYQSITSIALGSVLSGLLLMSSGKPVQASGSFVFDHSTEKPVYVIFTAGSSARFSGGTTTSASSYSSYPGGYASSAPPSTSGSASGTSTLYYYWVGDGLTPRPNCGVTVNTTGHADGSTNPDPGSAAAAGSGAGSLASGSAPSAYSKTNKVSNDQGNPAPPQINVVQNVSAHTSAGPDSTADPQHEYYGNATAASAGANLSTTLVTYSSI